MLSRRAAPQDEERNDDDRKPKGVISKQPTSKAWLVTLALIFAVTFYFYISIHKTKGPPQVKIKVTPKAKDYGPGKHDDAVFVQPDRAMQLLKGLTEAPPTVHYPGEVEPDEPGDEEEAADEEPREEKIEHNQVGAILDEREREDEARDESHLTPIVVDDSPPAPSTVPLRPFPMVNGPFEKAQASDDQKKARERIEKLLERYAPVEKAEPYNGPLYTGMDAPLWLKGTRQLLAKHTPRLDTFVNVPNPRKDAPAHGDITLVSGIFDLGRGELSEKDGTQFHRDFSVYEDSFKRFLSIKMPKVVFLQPQVAEKLKPFFDNMTYWVPFELSDFHRTLGGEAIFERMQAIRTNPEWYLQTGPNGWLLRSPQAKLKYYNPMVMSKVQLISMARLLDPWNSNNFLFIDGGHQCMDPDKFKLSNMGVMYQHMQNGFLCSYYWYGPGSETHGFRWKEQCDMMTIPPNVRIKVVRGGILGGPAHVIELVDKVYMYILRMTINAGLMGTEESLLAILVHVFPDLFLPFSNDDACNENLQGDHACEQNKNGKFYTNRAGNCAIFDWAYDGPPPRTKWDYLNQ